MRLVLSFGLASTACIAGILAWSCGPTDVTCEDLANCTRLVEDVATDERAADGVSLYGGFDCATWSYGGARAKVSSPTGPALVLRGLTAGVTLADFELASPNATVLGTSSVGAIVDTSLHVLFERVKITSG